MLGPAIDSRTGQKEITVQLHISVATVKYHIAQILERLHLKSRYELADYTRQQGRTD